MRVTDGLPAPGQSVVVLLSGGRDSTCLLHLCVTRAAAVTALHVNYGLRADADGDERHCRELCSALGVELRVHGSGPHPGGNLQAWAREERYRAATRLALARGALVAVGHTADDQVETILYRLASSPSRRAVLGMRARDGLLIRPLLSWTRAETTAYCERHGLGWREDASNASDEYARNRIRRQLVPAFRRLHPAAEQNLLALAARLADEQQVLDELVARELGDPLGDPPGDPLGDPPAGASRSISLARLRELPPALRRLVVQRLADDALGAIAAGAGARAGELAALSEHGTVTLDVGHGLRAISEYGRLRFAATAAGGPKGDTDPGGRRTAPKPPRETAHAAAATLKVPGEVRLGDAVVRCEPAEPLRQQGVLDRDALADELTVRTWRAGDRMRPLGLHGSKSLQDLFTARRVPRERRAGVAVVQSGGEIAWVEGVATGEPFKVTDATTRAVRLSANRLAG